ncbi:glutaredoxin family protein [Rheinheimera sp. UJ63]|uniref:glutaredoxin family protein n=1 Tax=Rheinheimera sp. UJ63 TaxID=2910157 RepID=UPI001F4794EA|nr:glutaredoxin family protein [Rheinheimera sp. UJ63]MCF4009598.1 glutaredoxin family protein [Rheinheimera sp. UJ63]
MAVYTLYSTWGCHLCEEAESLLATAGITEQTQVLDIIDDEQLLARFRVHIPVLAGIDQQGNENLLYWPFTAAQLQHWLKDTK